MTAGAPSASLPERATYLRPTGLAGVEALHASFVTHAYRPHSHPTWTLAMVVRGAAAFALDDTAQRADDGDLFLLEPESVHTGAPRCPAAGPTRCSTSTPACSGRGPRRAARRPAPPAGSCSATRDCGARSRRRTPRWPGRRPGWRWTTRSLGAVDALRPHLRSGPRAPRTRPEHAAVRRARAYLDERWAVRVSLAELAAHAGLSRFELARTFRAQVGLPPHAYQLDRRIARARALLAAGEPVAWRGADLRLRGPAALHADVQARGRRHARRLRKIVQDGGGGARGSSRPWR